MRGVADRHALKTLRPNNHIKSLQDGGGRGFKPLPTLQTSNPTPFCWAPCAPPFAPQEKRPLPVLQALHHPLHSSLALEGTAGCKLALLVLQAHHHLQSAPAGG